MSFQQQAESWRAKAHLEGARLPVLVGITSLAALVLFGVGALLFEAATHDGFKVVHPQEQEQASAGADDPQPAAAEAAVCVHVGGAVAAPGVYEVPEGSRVRDAVEAAGGFAQDAAHDALNLARAVADGEQIVVPTQQAADQAAAESVFGPSTGASGKIDINRATAEQLDALPGIGPSTAQKIVADREANGPFAACEDLKRVAGIGDKKYAELADAICV